MLKLILACLLVFLGAALAAQTNTTEYPPIGPSPDVSTVFVFPDHPNKGTWFIIFIYLFGFYSFYSAVITAGDVVEVLLGFVNNGEREFNITYVFASLNHPLDYRYYIQNVWILEYFFNLLFLHYILKFLAHTLQAHTAYNTAFFVPFQYSIFIIINIIRIWDGILLVFFPCGGLIFFLFSSSLHAHLQWA